MRQALFDYVPRPYAGPLAAIFAQEGRPRQEPWRARGWEHVNPQVQVIMVPGHHGNLFAEHARELGAELRRLIAEALGQVEA